MDKKKNGFDRMDEFPGDPGIWAFPPYTDDLFFPYYNEKFLFDPDGSWTGVPASPDAQPLQDADDL